jgi:hypothetical protein
MEDRLSTVETLSWAGAGSRTQESPAAFREKFLGRVHTPDAVREGREAALREMHDVARSELARRRGRLGNLTPEQQQGVETLLISTVNRFSEMLISVMELLEAASRNG